MYVSWLKWVVVNCLRRPIQVYYFATLLRQRLNAHHCCLAGWESTTEVYCQVRWMQAVSRTVGYTAHPRASRRTGRRSPTSGTRRGPAARAPRRVNRRHRRLGSPAKSVSARSPRPWSAAARVHLVRRPGHTLLSHLRFHSRARVVVAWSLDRVSCLPLRQSGQRA